METGEIQMVFTNIMIIVLNGQFHLDLRRLGLQVEE